MPEEQAARLYEVIVIGGSWAIFKPDHDSVRRVEGVNGQQIAVRDHLKESSLRFRWAEVLPVVIPKTFVAHLVLDSMRQGAKNLRSIRTRLTALRTPRYHPELSRQTCEAWQSWPVSVHEIGS